MGRSSLVVKATELQNIIDQLEAKQTFINMSELQDAIADTPWAKDIRNEKHAIRGLSPQMVYIKIKEFGLTTKTKAGKKGRVAGAPVVKTSRREKLAKNPRMKQFAKDITSEINTGEVPDTYKKAADGAIAGEMRGCVKLMCGQCFGYTGNEKSCDNTRCGLYPLNLLVFPNRRKLVENAEGFYDSERDKE